MSLGGTGGGNSVILLYSSVVGAIVEVLLSMNVPVVIEMNISFT